MMDTDTTRSDTCRCDKLGAVLEVQDGGDMSSRSDIGTPRMTILWHRCDARGCCPEARFEESLDCIGAVAEISCT